MGLKAYFAERRRKREVERLIIFILEKFAAGHSITDIIVWHVDRAVEWDVKLQCWTVFSEEEIEEGQRLYLESGRGGVAEESRVVERTAVDGGFLYTLIFDTWSFDLDADGNKVFEIRVGDVK